MIQRFEGSAPNTLVAYTPLAERDYRFRERFVQYVKMFWLKTFVRWETFCIIVGFLLGRALILSSLSPFFIPFFATVFVLKKTKRWLAFVSILAGASSLSIKHGLFAFMALFSFLIVRAIVVKLFKIKLVKVLPYLVFIADCSSRLLYDYAMAREWLWTNTLTALTEAGLSFLLTLIFLQSLPFLSMKIKKKTLKTEEIICFIILLASVLTGTIGWQISDLSMDHVLSRYFILLFGFVGGAAIGSTVGVVVGLILSLANVASLYQMSLLAFSGLLGGLLKEAGKAGVSVGLMIGTLLIGLYGDGYQHLLGTTMESLLAILLFLLTPKILTAKIASYIPGTKEYNAEQQQYVRKLRDVTASRVEQFSSLFQTLSNSFSNPGVEDTDRETDAFLSNVTACTCQTCFRKEHCWVKNFDQTYDLMTQIMNETGEGNKEISDPKLKRALNDHCIKANKVVEAILEEQKSYGQQAKLKQKVKESRRLVAEQLRGVSQVMGDFASEIKRERDTHQLQEEQILQKLQELGLEVDNVEIYNLEEGAVDIEMTLPNDYFGQCEKVIAPLLSDILEESIIVGKEKQAEVPGGPCQVIFCSARTYEIETGVAHTAKGGGWISGDNYSMFELGAGKYAIAISDGMGNGERADNESSDTLKLLSKVLKSGINETVAIKSINSILSLRTTEEIFSTLDLAMIDLQDAKAKFLKIGSNPSFIKRGNSVRMVDAGNLPMGMIEDFDVDVINEQLKSGDLLIMMSDGIYDAPKNIENKEAWIKRKIREIQTDDPQDIADLILEDVIRAADGFIEDDMTIVVSKIKHHIPKWAAIPAYTKVAVMKRKAQ